MVVVATFIVECRPCSRNSLWCIHSYACDSVSINCDLCLNITKLIRCDRFVMTVLGCRSSLLVIIGDTIQNNSITDYLGILNILIFINHIYIAQQLNAGIPPTHNYTSFPCSMG